MAKSPSIVRSGNVIAAFFGNAVEVIQWREVELHYGVKPLDLLAITPIESDALLGDGIADGDFVIAKLNFTTEELTPGKLVLAITPLGLLVSHLYLTLEGNARFVASNITCMDVVVKKEDFKIIGVIVEVVDGLENINPKRQA